MKGSILFRKVVFTFVFVLIFSAVYAKDAVLMIGNGSCTIIGMTGEQAKLTALQRARADAIEKVSGVRVSSNTVVTNGELSLDLIKTYTSGYIVKETVKSIELGSYTDDESSAPIPEYLVQIEAEVVVPEKKPSLGLKSRLNKKTFSNGEAAAMTVEASVSAGFAIFNIMANDRVVMLYPNTFKAAEKLSKGKVFSFPPENAVYDLVMSTLPEHQRDTEAFMVAASADPSVNFEVLYGYNEEMTLAEFYGIYAKIAEKTEEVMLPYQVFSE